MKYFPLIFVTLLISISANAMTVTERKSIGGAIGGCGGLDRYIARYADSTYVNDQGDTLKYGTPDFITYGTSCAGSPIIVEVSWKLDKEGKYFANMWEQEGWLSGVGSIYGTSVYFQTVSSTCMGKDFNVDATQFCHLDTSFTVSSSDWNTTNVSDDSNVFSPYIAPIVSLTPNISELSGVNDWIRSYKIFSYYQHEPFLGDSAYVYCLYKKYEGDTGAEYKCRIIGYCSEQVSKTKGKNYIYTYLDLQTSNDDKTSSNTIPETTDPYNEAPLVLAEDPKVVDKYCWKKLTIKRYSDGSTKKFLEK